MASLLVTNDFPPKHGGIQSYLYELWRRLPPEQTTVLTAPYAGDRAFDAAQAFRIERTAAPVLLPTRGLATRIDALARAVRADVVFLDPALPLGWLGRRVRAAPHVVVVHGAEVAVPARLPGPAALLRRVLRGAAGVVAAGGYPAREATRAARRGLRGIVVPPGVDIERFRPPTSLDERRATRSRFGLDPHLPTVVGVSRLVPRKGFDVLVSAAAMLGGDVQTLIVGDGRDRQRLESRSRASGARVRFAGRVPDAELPLAYRAGDVFAVPCRDRWGGLESEGFGIVFLEAAASGLPAVAGCSGGSHEAVLDGETGFVVDGRDPPAVRRALDRLLGDDGLRSRLGGAARERAERECSYDRRVELLRPLAAGDLATLGPLTEP